MYQRILVPVDGSETAALALDSAITLARAFQGRIRLIHVIDPSIWMTGYDPYAGSSAGLYEAVRRGGDELLRAALDKVDAAGVEADTVLVDQSGERLGEAVAHAASLWAADLVVVGTHGRRGVSRLLMGSGAEQVIRLAPVPVLVVRAKEVAA